MKIQRTIATCKVGIHLVVEGEDFNEDNESGYKRIDTTRRKKKRDQ